MQYLITERSANLKTGPMMVTTSEAKTCPTACPFKNAGCYAKGGPLGMLWKALSGAPDGATTVQNGRGKVALKSFSDLLAAIGRQSGKLWRLNQAGDLPGEGDAIDSFAVDDIVQANLNAKAKGFTYTHKPVLGEAYSFNRQVIADANAEGFTINLSADNLADADAKLALGIAPVAVVLPHDQTENTVTPAGNKVVVCPATIRDDVSCIDCGLCQRPKRPIIGFPAHGASKAKASAVAAS